MEEKSFVIHFFMRIHFLAPSHSLSPSPKHTLTLLRVHLFLFFSLSYSLSIISLSSSLISLSLFRSQLFPFSHLFLSISVIPPFFLVLLFLSFSSMNDVIALEDYLRQSLSRNKWKKGGKFLLRTLGKCQLGRSWASVF